MADEYVCEECAYTSINNEKACPLCGGRIVSLDDGYEQDSGFSDAYQDDLDMSMDDDFDLDAEGLPRAL